MLSTNNRAKECKRWMQECQSALSHLKEEEVSGVLPQLVRMRLLRSFVTKAAEYIPNMVPSAKGLGARDQARENKATCALAGPERNGRVSALSLKLQST